jgi:hypothetical protein
MVKSEGWSSRRTGGLRFLALLWCWATGRSVAAASAAVTHRDRHAACFPRRRRCCARVSLVLVLVLVPCPVCVCLCVCAPFFVSVMRCCVRHDESDDASCGFCECHVSFMSHYDYVYPVSAPPSALRVMMRDGARVHGLL